MFVGIMVLSDVSQISVEYRATAVISLQRLWHMAGTLCYRCLDFQCPLFAIHLWWLLLYSTFYFFVILSLISVKFSLKIRPSSTYCILWGSECMHTSYNNRSPTAGITCLWSPAIGRTEKLKGKGGTLLLIIRALLSTFASQQQIRNIMSKNYNFVKYEKM